MKKPQQPPDWRNQTCGTCRFHDPFDPRGLAPCRRFPPVFGLYAGYPPVTELTPACAEWRREKNARQGRTAKGLPLYMD